MVIYKDFQYRKFSKAQDQDQTPRPKKPQEKSWNEDSRPSLGSLY